MGLEVNLEGYLWMFCNDQAFIMVAALPQVISRHHLDSMSAMAQNE